MRADIFSIALAAAASLLMNSAHADDGAAMCAAMADTAHGAIFDQIPEARTTILSAKVVEAQRDLPRSCRIEGIVAPTVGILMYLPLEGWNGKLLMTGCGGACGDPLPFRMEPALVRRYAVVTTDLGHKGNASNFAFGYQNLLGVVDFGFRATHVTAVAGKVLAETFYRTKTSRNYFWGCSTGGRQALIEAQHFPEDFDGILGGAPPLNETGDAAYHLAWILRANVGADGKKILSEDKLPMIKRAVMKSCDAADGLADAVLQNPAACSWDPAEIQCKTDVAGSECLSPAEVQVVRKVYSGAVNSKGEALYFGMPRGSEDQWGQLLGVGEYAAGTRGITETLLKYASFYDFPGASWRLEDFDYDRDPPRLDVMEMLYNAQNPDLRRFKKRGGKMILYTGWNDNNIPAGADVDYYETVTRTMGGEAATQDFFRLFMLPSVNHCQYGAGGGEVDWIGTLENWVEKGIAPGQVQAFHMLVEPYPLIPGDRWPQMARHPLKPGSYDRSRPVYAYPDVARWSGKGDPNQPETWIKAPRK